MGMGCSGFEMGGGGAIRGQPVVEYQIQKGHAPATAQYHRGQQGRLQAD
jgi:hypothetical protein